MKEGGGARQSCFMCLVRSCPHLFKQWMRERVERRRLETFFGWVGGWVGWVEENEVVRMSYCGLLLGWVGGWVGG